METEIQVILVFSTTVYLSLELELTVKMAWISVGHYSKRR